MEPQAVASGSTVLACGTVLRELPPAERTRCRSWFRALRTPTGMVSGEFWWTGAAGAAAESASTRRTRAIGLAEQQERCRERRDLKPFGSHRALLCGPWGSAKRVDERGGRARPPSSRPVDQ